MSLKEDVLNIERAMASGNEFERLTANSALTALIRLTATIAGKLEALEAKLLEVEASKKGRK